MDKQAKDELRIFKKFAKICPYPVDFDSIEKRYPPEPDISCKLSDGTPTVFELVECIDNSIACSTYEPLKLEQVFNIELEKIPKIKTNFSDASISIAFCKDISKNKKLHSIKTISNYLLALENGVRGEFDLKLQPNLKGVVKRISINRDRDDGPVFYIDREATWFSNPVVERIKIKFNNIYEAKCKIELLCYYELQPELPQHHWLPLAKEFIKANLKRSQFHRVWIYSVTKNKIIYVYPEYNKVEKAE